MPYDVLALDHILIHQEYNHLITSLFSVLVVMVASAL